MGNKTVILLGLLRIPEVAWRLSFGSPKAGMRGEGGDGEFDGTWRFYDSSSSLIAKPM